MLIKPKIARTSLCLMCFVFLMFTGCDEFSSTLRDTMQGEPKIEPVDSSLATANTRFGFNLFNEIQKTERDKNIFISPFSVSVTLAMTLNGAAGGTEQAMIHTLQLQNLDSELINAGYAQLLQDLQVPSSKVTLTIANSLWAHSANQDFAFLPDFLQRNTQFFSAEITELDLQDPGTPAEINQWVDTQTKGEIKKIIQKIDKETGLLLLNAIYFKGEWQTEFNPSRTEDETFYLATGEEKSIPMMRKVGYYPCYHGENFQAVSLPYGDGRISMYIFLPARKSNLNTFLDDLNAESWENWVSQLYREEVYIQIPKFNLAYDITLNNPLKSLGMEIAFDRKRADFRRMAYSPTDKPLLTWIQKVSQKAVVEVNEEGTVAAAVTGVGIGILPISAPPLFIADRPFFFAIRDNQTKTVLFMGIVGDPTKE